MSEKRHALIIDNQEDWQELLQQAFPTREFDVKAARAYKEAVKALEVSAFDVIVLDPIVDSVDKDGQLRLLGKLLPNFPQTPLIIVAESAGRARLQQIARLPAELPILSKDEWDNDAFEAAIQQVLSGEGWQVPEPEITPPDSDEPQPTPAHHHTDLTGPLQPTGWTRPLQSGLIPPPIASRMDKPRVLIIEDREDWQHVLAYSMETEGYFWRVAATYEQAIERLRLESFHVVLLDLVLGDVNVPLPQAKGWQLLDYIISHYPKTKVIATSGEASRSDVAKLFMRYPIKGFIDKDAFHADELMTMVREQIAGPSLKIQTLGGFRVWRDGKPINNFGSEHAEAILKILLTRRGESVSADELIECLWPGSDPKAAYADLGTQINNARAALEPDLPRLGDSTFIVRQGATYTFNFMANVEVDAQQLRRFVSEGYHHERGGQAAEAQQDYESARALYQGDYLPDNRFDQWAIQERSALQALYTEALNRLADLYAADGKLDQAIEAATRSLQVDSYIESTYRRLMRYQTCKGNRKAALATYRSLVKLFSEFFGEEPSVVTMRLHDDIEAGNPVVCVETTMVSGEWRMAGEH